MYLEKLKILGFKSFARKTTFDLTGGITAIVGPNGCGKSNIVDALRWVLGEQKAGALRSERMESVIFNGSAEMKPMGMAEVAITIKNTKNILPVEYAEVVITRRLFRSGESQYMINNAVCRLKDINDLLMDTGMAADAYSVIELKMVESILSGKPEERRRIFEEAAGITKYKQRRKITFRKLESTESDLVRVKDIIGEVESKVNSLRRQVRKAQHYQKLNEMIRDAEIRVSTFHYSKIYDELTPLTEQLELKKRERQSESTETSFKEAETESLKTELIQIEQNLRQSQIELNSLNDLIRKREEEILVKKERITSLTNDDVRLNAEIQDLTKRINEQKKINDHLNQNLEQFYEKIDLEEKTFGQEEKTLEDIEKELKYKREQGKQSDNELIRLLDKISQKQRTIEHLKAKSELMVKRIADLQKEKTQENIKIDDWKNQYSVLEKSNTEASQKFANLNDQQQQLINRLNEINQAHDTCRDEIVKGYSQLDTLQHRIAILNKLLESYADFPEGVRHLMMNKNDYPGTVADKISVSDEYRPAIEAVLGEAATYLLVTEADQAFIGLRSLEEEQKGVVTFLALNKIGVKKQANVTVDLPPDKNILGWADEYTQCAVQYQPLMKILLGDYLIVNDLLTAKKLMATDATNSLNMVTLNGEVLTSWGAIKGGKKSHQDTGIIGRRDQLKKFHEDVAVIQNKINNDEAGKQQLEQERLIVNQNKEKIQQEITALNKELSDFKLSLSQFNYKISQSEERIDKIEKEAISLSAENKIAEGKMKEIERDFKLEQQDRIDREERLSSINEEIETVAIKREALSQKVQQMRLNLVRLTADAKSVENEMQRGMQLISESERAIENKGAEKITKQTQREEHLAQIDSLTTALTSDYDKKEKLEAVVIIKEEKQLTLKNSIDQKEKVLRKLRTDRESSFESIHNMELRIAELKLNADNLYRQMSEEYNWDLKQEAIDPEYNVELDKQEIERTKQRIKALGLVNMLALKEYESEKERLDFLTKQHEDLVQAKQNLNETVAYINKTACDKFNDVFQNIRKNFSEVFNQFFSEGQADLTLAEDNDPLEANIEIMANPKSKRATSLTLLSGGEKALTAISLLFAIYLVKPSPFCILDEVDAPLDDTNIKRFTDALKRFSNDTQFLVVTHNKLTMKAADSLYGVTLEDSGISKVVSVKLD